MALYRLHYEDIEMKYRCQQALEELQIQKERTNKVAKEVDEKLIFKAEGVQSLKQIQYLLGNKPEIFNITPPNAKDEGKGRATQRYQLTTSNRDEFRGFTRERVTPQEEKGGGMPLVESRDKFPGKLQNIEFDPFANDFCDEPKLVDEKAVASSELQRHEAKLEMDGSAKENQTEFTTILRKEKCDSQKQFK